MNKIEEDFFNDISPIQGVYSDFIYLKEHALVSMVKVKGLNLDLLSELEQNTLFDEYGAYIAQNVHYLPQNVSVTVPINMSDYLYKWKVQYLSSINDEDCPEPLKQLRASYLYEYQKAETSLGMAKKEHFIVLKEKLKQPTLENLHESEKRLLQKTHEIKDSIHQVLDQYDGEEEIISASEALSVLHRLLDYRTSIFS